MKVGIIGYGNLGKAVESLLQKNKTNKLIAIFSKRNNLVSPFNTKIDNLKNLKNYINKIDTLIICSGSFDELEVIGPEVLKNFNTIDSFDTHSKLLRYKNKLDLIAKLNKKVAITACGWDPGLMSVIRTIFNSFSDKKSESFWGMGVSQGHSNAIRKIDGVINAIQYTIPVEKEIENIKNDVNYIPESYNKHKRICYVAIQENIDKLEIEEKIKNMKNYFLGYETIVNFVNNNEIIEMQKNLSHKGLIVDNFNLVDYENYLEFKLNIDSNPIFTANILICYLIALNKLIKNKKFGAYTVLDIPVSFLIKDDNKVYNDL